MFTVSKRMMQIVREVKEKKRKKSNRIETKEREKSRNQTQRLPIQDTKPNDKSLFGFTAHLSNYTHDLPYPTSDTPTHSRALTLGSKLEEKKASPIPPNATPTCTPHYLMINNNID